MLQKVGLLTVALVMQSQGWLATPLVATQRFYSKPKAIRTFAHGRVEIASPLLGLALHLSTLASACSSPRAQAEQLHADVMPWCPYE